VAVSGLLAVVSVGVLAQVRELVWVRQAVPLVEDSRNRQRSRQTRREMSDDPWAAPERWDGGDVQSWRAG